MASVQLAVLERVAGGAFIDSDADGAWGGLARAIYDPVAGEVVRLTDGTIAVIVRVSDGSTTLDTIPNHKILAWHLSADLNLLGRTVVEANAGGVDPFSNLRIVATAIEWTPGVVHFMTTHTARGYRISFQGGDPVVLSRSTLDDIPDPERQISEGLSFKVAGRWLWFHYLGNPDAPHSDVVVSALDPATCGIISSTPVDVDRTNAGTGVAQFWSDPKDPSKGTLVLAENSLSVLRGLTSTPEVVSSSIVNTDFRGLNNPYTLPGRPRAEAHLPGFPFATGLLTQSRDSFGIPNEQYTPFAPYVMDATASRALDDAWAPVFGVLAGAGDAFTATVAVAVAAGSPGTDYYVHDVLPAPPFWTTSARFRGISLYHASVDRVTMVTFGLNAADTRMAAFAARWRLPPIPKQEQKLRLSQRNDGLGTVPHPRLLASRSNAPSSVQRSVNPRLGTNNRYL